MSHVHSNIVTPDLECQNLYLCGWLGANVPACMITVTKRRDETSSQTSKYLTSIKLGHKY